MAGISVDVDLSGFEALKSTMRKFADDRTQTKLLNAACGSGATVLKREMQARSPSTRLEYAARTRTGVNAARVLRVRRSVAKAGGLAAVGFRQPHSRLTHLIEFGTSERVQKTTGRKTGRMPARPFIRPAMQSSKADIVTAMKKNLTKGINREIFKIRGSRGKR